MLERVLAGWPSKRGLAVLFWVALAAFAALSAVLVRLDARLQGAGHGIVVLELASRPAEVDRILSDWARGDATDDAILSIEVDFAYLLAYSVLLAAAALWTARQETGVLRKVGFALVPACLVAGLFDAVENVLDLSMLRLGHGDPVRAALGTAFATAKFAILALAACFLVWRLGPRAVRCLWSWTRSPLRPWFRS